ARAAAVRLDADVLDRRSVRAWPARSRKALPARLRKHAARADVRRNFWPAGQLASPENRTFVGSLRTQRSRSTPPPHVADRAAAPPALRRAARRPVPGRQRRGLRGHPRPLPPAAVRLHAPDAGGTAPGRPARPPG